MLGATTLSDLLAARAAMHPNRELMRCGDDRWTYGDVDRIATLVANSLAASGRRPGERIGVLADETGEAWLLLFGAARAGVVPVLVNWRLAGPEVAVILDDADCEVVFHTARLDDEARRAGGPWKVLSVEQFVADAVDAAPRPATTAAALPAPDATDDVVQLYTSGTTGIPKGVRTNNANLLALMDVVATELPGFASDSVTLVVAPLFHIAGLGFGVAALETGARMVLLPVFEPGAVVDLIETERPTHSLIVPAMLTMVCAVDGVEARDFSSMRGVLYGGSPISLQLMDRARDVFGCRFSQAYGLTETTGIATMLRWDDHERGLAREDDAAVRRLASAGYPIPGTTVRVVDATGAPLPAGQPGEVLVSSPMVMAGYWNRADANDAASHGGWFRSGDVGYLDDGGYLFLVDRMNDMIVSKAENVLPGEVERVIAEHPSVVEVAVIGVPDDEFGEVICAVVVCRSTPPTIDELREWCRPHLAGFKLPRRIELADELPKTPSGKVQRRLVREPYWRGRDRRIN